MGVRARAVPSSRYRVAPVPALTWVIHPIGAIDMRRKFGLEQGWTRRVHLALVVAWTAWALLFATPACRAAQAVELRAAQRTLPGDVERAVTLPDEIAFAPVPGTVQSVRYRVTVALPAGASGYSLYFPGLLSHARVRINDQILTNQLALAGTPSPRSIDAIQLIRLPDGMLRAGDNEVEVLAAAVRGVSVSTLWIGPHGELSPLYERKVVWAVIGPLLVATAIGCLALSVLLLWLRARSEPLYGYFGVGALCWALHSAWTVLPVPLLPGVHNGIWWTALYSFFVSMLAIFAIRFARWRWPRFERGLWWMSAAAPAVFYAAHAVGGLEAVANAWRLGMVGVAFVGLAAVGHYAWRKRNVDSVLLTATGLASAGLGLRDWLVSHGSDNNPVFLIPYAGLMFIALVAWMLIDRFVRASRELETMNMRLEERVAEKSAALVIALEQMRAARDAAELANRAKSAFLAASSHDLRQPIHALGLYVAALRQQALPPAPHEVVERMSRSVAALGSMFDALLDISRMDAGVVAAAPCAWAVDDLLHRLADEFAVTAADKGLRLAVRVDRRAGSLAACTDPLLFERVLRNLLANAIKYTERGGVLLSGRLRCGAAGAVWRFQVWDTGAGIPADEFERVFEAFYQVGYPQGHRGAGLGLGLSIVKRLTQLLALQLSMRSQVARGSCFTIDVPATTERPAPAAEAELATPLRGLSVAVVEDDPEVRDGMKTLLLHWGCSVSEGADADEVLAQHRRQCAAPLQAIVADYQLRDRRTGVAEIARLRHAVGAVLPALIVTADSAPERLAQIQTTGLPWLTKPLPAARLRSWLHGAAPRAPMSTWMESTT